jgi:protein-disulfide reductase (glutathione)
MHRIFSLLALLMLVCSPSAAVADIGLARGWGDEIAWRSLPEGLVQAASEQKPLCLLVWKTWCGACKALRPKFAASSAILAESSNFVMVNVVDDEEPQDAKYKPGGAGYIPRVLFLRPDGSIMTDVQSGNDQYKYFFGDPEGIVGAMRVAAKRAAAAALEGAVPPPEGENEDL